MIRTFTTNFKVKPVNIQPEQDKCLCNICYTTKYDIESQNGKKCSCLSGFICNKCLNPLETPSVINYQDILSKCPVCRKPWTNTKTNNNREANRSMNINLSMPQIYINSNRSQYRSVNSISDDQINFNINIDISRNNSMIRDNDNFRPRDCLEAVFNRRIENTTRKKIDCTLMTIYTITLIYLIGIISIIYVDPSYMDKIFSNWDFAIIPFIVGFCCFSFCNISSMCCCNTNIYECFKMYRFEFYEN